VSSVAKDVSSSPTSSFWRNNQSPSQAMMIATPMMEPA